MSEPIFQAIEEGFWNDCKYINLKLVKYYPSNGASRAQGVGAHQDETGWLTFVSEVDQPGLQVHLRGGDTWEMVQLPKAAWALNIG